jgi:hypothetical protein
MLISNKGATKRLATASFALLTNSIVIAACLNQAAFAKLPYGRWVVQPNGQIFFYRATGNPIVVYNGTQRAVAIERFGDALYTAFDGGGIYRSPDGENLGGGGLTAKVYPGPQTVRSLLACGNSLYTAFSGGGIYRSLDGNNLGGGGMTERVYSGTQLVRKIICSNRGSVITTFDGGGVYESPDGLNLGGGGRTFRLN